MIYTHTVYIFLHIHKYYNHISHTHARKIKQVSSGSLSVSPIILYEHTQNPKLLKYIHMHMLYYYVIFNLLCTNSGIMPFNVPLTCNIYERQNTKTPILVLITKLSIGKRKYTIINHIKDTIKL